MTRRSLDQDEAHRVVDRRRAHILACVARPVELAGRGAQPLPAERRAFLLREAEDLYWNELLWEEQTREERVMGGHLTELVFPGFLSFIGGLLPESSPRGGDAPGPRPHPDVVEEILHFLGERVATFAFALRHGADSERVVWARTLTAGLIDLVLVRLFQLTPLEREELDALD